MKQEKNDIAVCVLGGRICPRFDLSHEIHIYDVKTSDREPSEKIDVSSLSPLESLNLLVGKEVRTVIVGGIQERYQAIFLDHHIKVIWGVMGEVNDVIQVYKKKSLYPGIGRVFDFNKPAR
jgi:predicted Fe-Mo cluster-binding NifX family protein